MLFAALWQAWPVKSRVTEITVNAGGYLLFCRGRQFPRGGAMTFMSDLCADVQAGLADLAGPLTYRALSTFSTKAATTAPIGTSTVTLGSLPGGLGGVIVGDQLVAGVQTRIVASGALAIGDTITAPIAAALTAPIASGSTIVVNRKVEMACSGWLHQLDVTRVVGLVTAGDASVSILANTLSAAPRVGDQVVADGKTWTIKSVARDVAGACWTLQCSGGN